MARPITVLIIEDNPVEIEIYRSRLDQRRDLGCVYSSSYESALEALIAARIYAPLNAIIADLGIRGRDGSYQSDGGIDVLRFCQESNLRIPFAFLTIAEKPVVDDLWKKCRISLPLSHVFYKHETTIDQVISFLLPHIAPSYSTHIAHQSQRSAKKYEGPN